MCTLIIPAQCSTLGTTIVHKWYVFCGTFSVRDQLTDTYTEVTSAHRCVNENLNL